MSEKSSFFSELKRRNVYKVAVAYAVVGWLVIQVSSTVLPTFHTPEWVVQTLMVLVALGFPIALLIAWAFELTPQGLKRTEDVDLAALARTKSHTWIYVVIIGAVLSVGLFFVGRYTALRTSLVDNGQPPATEASVSDKSITVLAFTNLSDDKGNEYFSDGISEELLNVLSKVPGLKVSARTSAFHFKGKDTPIPEIAQQLGVAYVVEGSVRKSGDRVRITAQLVKAADGFHIWSENFDRELKDIFAVQDEIAGLIAKNLQLKLDTGNVADVGGTKNVAAYEAFLKGRQAWNSNTASGYREAVPQFLRAIELDPDFALTHGALAEAYVSLANEGQEPAKKMFPLARASAERALALDSRIVQAHTALAEYAFHYEWDYEKSDRYLQQALAVDPNYSIAHDRLSGHLEARNRLKEALAEAQRAKELNPLDATASTAWTLVLMKRYDEAIEAARHEIALNPKSANPRENLGVALFRAGKRDEALNVLEEIDAGNLTEPEASAYLGWAYGQSGQTEKARDVLDRMTAIGATRFVSPRVLAIVASGLNDRDLAIAQLERAFELRDPRLPSIGNDPGFDPIRVDPRFGNLLKRLKLDVYFSEAPNK